MKYLGIAIGADGYALPANVTIYAFPQLAATPLGKLLAALTEERVWSGEYFVRGYFWVNRALEIHHQGFLPGKTLWIHAEDVTENTTVRDVEDAVRAHFRDSAKSLEPEIGRLHELQNNLRRASDRIAADKAKAAIVAVFSEAVDSHFFAPNGAVDLYCFTLGPGFGNKIFVARKVGSKFTGGIARIKMAGDTWHLLSHVQQSQVFWEALAKAFAARELKIPEANLHDACVGMRAMTLGESASDDEIPPSVEAVSVEAPGGYVTITFDNNNLPVKAIFTPK